MVLVCASVCLSVYRAANLLRFGGKRSDFLCRLPPKICRLPLFENSDFKSYLYRFAIRWLKEQALSPCWSRTARFRVKLSRHLILDEIGAFQRQFSVVIINLTDIDGYYFHFLRFSTEIIDFWRHGDRIELLWRVDRSQSLFWFENKGLIILIHHG